MYNLLNYILQYIAISTSVLDDISESFGNNAKSIESVGNNAKSIETFF